MRVLKRIINLSVSTAIFMTHLILICHLFENNSINKNNLISSLEYEKENNLNINCSISDIHSNVELFKNLGFISTFLMKRATATSFFEKNNRFISIIFNKKKTRGPPLFKA